MSTGSYSGTGTDSPLLFSVDAQLIARFFVLLQQGVAVRRRVGCTIDAFLRREIDARPETIERIQSIMLDGKPVDDIGVAVVRDGSTLALSAAMPGLVGATLRRGGYYSSFRSGITYHEADQAAPSGEGWVTVKVFNLLMAELGPGLFRSGVRVKAADLLSILVEHAQELRQGCTVTLNGGYLDLGILGGSEGLIGAGSVFLSLSSATAV